MIPKNTLVRNNIKKVVKNECPYYLDYLKKIDVDDFQGMYHLSRRLNQMIKKRTNSMLSGSSIDFEEVGDLLELINERLILEGHDLEEAMNERLRQNEKYGNYSKHITTTSEVEVDSDIFLPYIDRGKIVTDRDYVSKVSRLQSGKEV